MYLTWSKGNPNYDAEGGVDERWKEILNDRGNEFTIGTIIKSAKEGGFEEESKTEDKFSQYTEAIRNAKSVDEIKDLFRSDDWKSEPVCSQAEQKTLPAICKKQANDILKEAGKKPNVTVDDFKPLILIKAALTGMDAIQPFFVFDVGRYCFIYNDLKLIENATQPSLVTTGNGLGLVGEVFKEFAITKSTLIQSVKRETDYMIKEDVRYDVK